MRTKNFFSGRKAGWLLFFFAAALIVAWNPGSGSPPETGETVLTPEAAEEEPVAPPPPALWDRTAYPTEQQELLDPRVPGVYQPTTAGTVESALFGSVRTTRQGKHLLPSFHKGVDIAALQRDRRGRPRDLISALADGEVAYLNRIAGNSSYGLYLVLIHDDPIGPVYTLYAHLSSFAEGLKIGDRVEAGRTLGTMGTSASYRIPLSRAHLHFEIGLVGNSRFTRWARSRKIRNDHGDYNGWNLMPIDPLEFFRQRAADPGFDFLSHLRSTPIAFEAIVRVEKFPDFFRRYPALWEGPPRERGAMVIECCQYGTPLRGRAADPAETEELANERIRIRSVDREALGRNGRRVIAFRKNRWTLGSNGLNWLSLLTY